MTWQAAGQSSAATAAAAAATIVPPGYVPAGSAQELDLQLESLLQAVASFQGMPPELHSAAEPHAPASTSAHPTTSSLTGTE